MEGPKTHEGRLHRGRWVKLAPGDILDAFNGRYGSVVLEVREILHYSDFDEAFEALGHALVPQVDTPEDALALYRQWNAAETVRECGGVVAVGVEVKQVQLMGECGQDITVPPSSDGVGMVSMVTGALIGALILSFLWRRRSG